MSAPYVASTTPMPIGKVNPGDLVFFSFVGAAGSGRDALGRWPHLLYLPTSIGAPEGVARYDKLLAGDSDNPSFRDAGSFVVPLLGQIYVAGGSGKFDITVAIRRGPTTCQAQNEYWWVLPHYTVAGARLQITEIPSGIKDFYVTTTSLVIVRHGAGATDTFAALGANIPVVVSGATRIDFEPAGGTQGQIVFRGRI